MAFGKITFEPGEQILAELCPNRRSLLFPVLELLLITGVTWALIGLIDHYLDAEALRLLGYSLPVPSQLAMHVGEPLYVAAQWGRRALVVLWLFLAWRRCGRQMIFRARSRMMLTNERLITATGHWRSQTAQVPLEYIVDARAKGSTVSVFVMGTRNPIVLRDVPYAKRFVRLIRSYTRAL
ncbi:hypothetical protein [uncultured Corynebacterium sp.]|uniref:hypothetical protein n=1 Tax=uncultured Corynebacterium sp. TaxID=159447 RepID=UPI00288ACDA8|nr:hypothetical protein [uncultured Corynebacterium sp.]